MGCWVPKKRVNHDTKHLAHFKRILTGTGSNSSAASFVLLCEKATLYRAQSRTHGETDPPYFHSEPSFLFPSE